MRLVVVSRGVSVDGAAAARRRSSPGTANWLPRVPTVRTAALQQGPICDSRQRSLVQYHDRCAAKEESIHYEIRRQGVAHVSLDVRTVALGFSER